jgi:hypothetical protein
MNPHLNTEFDHYYEYVGRIVEGIGRPPTMQELYTEMRKVWPVLADEAYRHAAKCAMSARYKSDETVRAVTPQAAWFAYLQEHWPEADEGWMPNV